MKLTLRSLWRRPLRTCLTIFGVSMGVVAYVALSAVAAGLWTSTNKAIHLGNADFIVMRSGTAVDILSTLDEHATREKLESVPGVDWVNGELWHLLPVDSEPLCLVLGWSKEDVQRPIGQLIEGGYPSSENDILLGSVLQRSINKSVGDVINVAGREMTVAGIFKANIVFYNAAALMLLPTAQELADKQDRVTLFYVGCDPSSDPERIARQVEETNPELVTITDVSEYHKVDQGLELAQTARIVVSFIAIVVGCVIVTNTMCMAVLERTREIGVLRAVGWSRRWIVGSMVLESAQLGMTAALVGCAGGMLLALISTKLPLAQQFIEPVYDVSTIASAIGIGLILSIAGAILPAWRAASVSPAEALRYE